MWGTIPANGARFRYSRKSAPLPSGIVPHIAAESCPTSNGISAPLRPESAGLFLPPLPGEMPPQFFFQLLQFVFILDHGHRTQLTDLAVDLDQLLAQAVELPVLLDLLLYLFQFRSQGQISSLGL